jgi:UDP-N-acetylglucosamine--N-acetylmuramyl-(pentapeptide) pyrophosphoryl-undecaprenol N-acetylglucosamine transferase
MVSGRPSVVIAAGGTGGHIYPGLALAEAVAAARPDARVSFVGTPRGMERTLVGDAGHELHLVDMVPFVGQGRDKLTVPFKLARATVQAARLLRRLKADVVVGMGGYVTVPVILAARLLRRPALVWEPGVKPGEANRLAARFSGHVATAFPAANASFRGDVRTIGMPLGGAIAWFDRDALRPEARAAFELTEGTSMVLVSGGSQGARTLNRLAVALAERWADRDDVRIVLKTGAKEHDAVTDDLRGRPGEHLVQVVRFLDRMDHAYAAADMMISRSGAGTVAELAAVGLPAVLVPLPHAEHTDQAENARHLVDAGGALLVTDDQATADVVGPLLEARLGDAAALEAMRAGLQQVAQPTAAADLAAWTLELAR